MNLTEIKEIGFCLNLLRYHIVFDKQELHDMLIEHQDGLCPICFESLTHESTKELEGTYLRKTAKANWKQRTTHKIWNFTQFTESFSKLCYWKRIRI